MTNFEGFTPQQQFSLMQKMGYSGAPDRDEMDKFLAASPHVAARLGKYSKVAQGMVRQTPAMSVGGLMPVIGKALSEDGFETNLNTSEDPDVDRSTLPFIGRAGPDAQPVPKPMPVPTSTATTAGSQESLNAAKQDLANAQVAFSQAQEALKADPGNEQLQQKLLNAQKALGSAQTTLGGAQQAFQTLNVPSVSEVTAGAIQTPETVLKKADVAQIEEKPDQIISEEVGKVSETAPTVEATTVEEVEKIEETPEVSASTIDATKISDEAKAELDQLEAAKGTVSPEGTVRGQLEILMEDFEGDATPPWASGAMRKAMAVMQSRGLGASSVAGQAITQAAMESAIAIASQDASTIAQFEMQNLNNEQQTLIFKTQQRLSALVSDQAAENAAKQFNAASENQVDQFMADLEVRASQFNAEQVNAIRQYNAGQENAIDQFNASLKNQRDQFNAQNSLVIAQANAQWRQQMTTTNTAAQNQANMLLAQQANGLTTAALDQIWQRERDIMAFAFTSAESAAERELQLLLADKSAQIQADSDRSQGIGMIIGSITRSIFGDIF